MTTRAIPDAESHAMKRYSVIFPAIMIVVLLLVLMANLFHLMPARSACARSYEIGLTAGSLLQMYNEEHCHPRG